MSVHFATGSFIIFKSFMLWFPNLRVSVKLGIVKFMNKCYAENCVENDSNNELDDLGESVNCSLDESN